MSHGHDDLMLNDSQNLHFEQVVAQGLQSEDRRSLIKGAFCLTASAVGFNALPLQAKSTGPSLGFEPVEKLLTDDVMLPPGYQYSVVHATGDAMNFNVPSFTSLGLETDDYTDRIGDQHDGMDIFFIKDQGQYTTKDTGRALLVVNHESSAEAAFLHVNGQTSGGKSGLKFDQFGSWDGGARPEGEVVKEINLHGVSVTEIRRDEKGQWKMVRGSTLNRHITPETEAIVTGAAQDLADIRELLATKKFPKGDRCRGTINNCGMGRTPWGTYLACEENFYPYFSRSNDAKPDARMARAYKRYGVVLDPPKAGGKNRSQGWHTVSGTPDDSRFERWDCAIKGASASTDYRQEPHTFGYVTEIDPTRADKPAKRVALGRFVHEAAVFGQAVAGKPLAVYMGCDGRNEYIYKFVSKANWDPKDTGLGIKAGNKYLTEGTLYAAKFNADGSGEWIELSMRNPAIANDQAFGFKSNADVLVFTRLAADAAGATPMDRPEWGAVNYANGEIYFALTNNSDKFRTPGKTNAVNPRAYQDADGKKKTGNPHGHIVRFKEAKGLGTAKHFQWDIFLFGSEDGNRPENLSKLTANNSFASPDGLWFSKATGICWIQTDDSAMTDQSNCMLLAAIPGQVGDGGKITVQNKLKDQSATQDTFIGATLGEARLRRFLVAPFGAEVTGLCETPDGKALFVNIQHPGEATKAKDLLEENFQSRWPGNRGYGKPGRPRSATIVITREDGGVIGL